MFEVEANDVGRQCLEVVALLTELCAVNSNTRAVSHMWWGVREIPGRGAEHGGMGCCLKRGGCEDS